MFKNEALTAEQKFRTSVEEAQEYIENFDILETINNVGNDEVFTPVKVCQQVLDILPDEVWANPNYKWLNPSDKNGVFHREIAIRLDEGLKDWEPDEEKRKQHILQNMLFSIGLTKFTSQVSRRTLYYCSDANRSFDGKRDNSGYSINGYAIGDGSWFDTPEGNIKTPSTTHKFVKGRCEFCGTREKNTDGSYARYSDPRQIEHYAYEFIHVDNIEKYLQKRFFGGKQMKFDIIIGNPPYHLDDGGAGASATALFYKFIEQAKRLAPKYITMIVPSKWLTREGKGIGYNDFCTTMINDRSIKELHDFFDYKDIFPSVNSIKGGVCYFLMDSQHNGKCTYYSYESNKTLVSKSKRFLNNKYSNIAIRDGRRVSIVEKILILKEDKFKEIVSSRNHYGFSGDIFKTGAKKYKLPELSEVNIRNGYEIHGLSDGNKREVRYIPSNYPIPRPNDDVNLWKIFTNRNVGDGISGSYKPNNIIGTPGSLCTDTYLRVGPFKSQKEAENCESYFKTKFFRLLVETIKSTQGVNKDVFELVPIQNFNESWTDEKLYQKYKLTDEEIKYIESVIQEMD